MERHEAARGSNAASRRPGRACRLLRIVAPILAAVAAAGLSGCGSISQKFADLGSQMPAVGLPAGAPERPSTAVAYPAVHDIPPPRASVVLTNVEQKQLEQDLLTARDEQQDVSGVPLLPGRVAPKKQQAAKKDAKKSPPALSAQSRAVPVTGSPIY